MKKYIREEAMEITETHVGHLVTYYRERTTSHSAEYMEQREDTTGTEKQEDSEFL